MLKLMRTTIIGGIIFLIPVAILVAVIGRGLKISGAIANPVADVLPVDMIGGVAVAHVFPIVLLVVICFLAGLLARLALARRAVDTLEAMCSPGSCLRAAEDQDPEHAEPRRHRGDVRRRRALRRPVADRLRDRADRGRQGRVFQPGSPDPWSGAVCIAEEDRVRALDPAGRGRRQHRETARKRRERGAPRPPPLNRLKPSRATPRQQALLIRGARPPNCYTTSRDTTLSGHVPGGGVGAVGRWPAEATATSLA